MTDIITKENRSWNMSRIKSRNTKPELIVRSFLHKEGFRFRLHKSNLPGKPDITLPKYKTVVFINGCFWHRHKSCRYAYNPKSRIKFWNNKFNTNMVRDKRNKKELENLGWKVVVIWECNISMDKLEKFKGLIRHG